MEDSHRADTLKKRQYERESCSIVAHNDFLNDDFLIEIAPEVEDRLKTRTYDPRTDFQSIENFQV